MIIAGIPTVLGVFTARFTERGLAQLTFPEEAAAMAQRFSEIPECALPTKRALAAILSGSSPQTLPALDLSAGSEFQRAVWRALLDVPIGHTKTYAQIAHDIGSPNATRAVGSACGANPIPVLIPCHRVVASGGRMGGFSAGLNWKRRLLAIEGAMDRELELVPSNSVP